MEEIELQNELASIRSIMERSSKFISLSGLSGILAGVYALIGAGIAYELINNDSYYLLIRRIDEQNAQKSNIGSLWVNVGEGYPSLVWKLCAIASLVLIVSIVTAIILSSRQAKKKSQPMWGAVSRQLLFHMAVPLLAGGAFIIILLFHRHYGIVSATSLVFYGLALVSASNFTFTDVKYLGLCEIILGLIAACLPGHGLLFWALGFGVLHIVYGARIYFKYDK